MAKYLFALSGLLFITAGILLFRMESVIPKDHMQTIVGVPLSTSTVPPMMVSFDESGLDKDQRVLIWAWHAVSALAVFTALGGLVVVLVKTQEPEQA